MTIKLSKIFFEVHSGLPREGPGDNESTRKAYMMLSNLPQNPKILDIGCGPGMQTRWLAHLSNSSIAAVDNHQPFLDQLTEAAEAEGISDRIHVVKGDMTSLNYADGSFDVVWSEGSIFIIGFEKGLRDWKRLLAPRGYLVTSHASWLKPDPPEEVKRFWAEVDSSITTIQQNLEIATRAGYDVVGYFVLPEKSWWDNYYTPILEKLPALRKAHAGDEEALRYVEFEELEIDMFRRYSDYYGYVFYVLQSRG
ncbi:MAG: class I SAM-dependent methyltransferase [Candidatus Bathyarchaeia archaeon]